MVDGEGDDVPGVDQWLAVVGDRDTEHPRLEENLESRSSQMPHARLGAARDWTAAKGPATTTVLLRHGETPLTAEGRFSGLGDVPLTDAGHGQATAAAARLAAHHRIELIVTSPLRRARDTADAVARATGAPLSVADGLAEADFGMWEGLTFAEVSQRWPEEMSAWVADPRAAPPGGESLTHPAGRVAAAVDALLAAHPGSTLLLVSHVTPIKALLCRALLAPPAGLFRLHLDAGSLSQIDWFTDRPPVVRLVNETGHLRRLGN